VAVQMHGQIGVDEQVRRRRRRQCSQRLGVTGSLYVPITRGMRSVVSRRQEPTQRSAIAFIRGTPGRMGATWTPRVLKTASNARLSRVASHPEACRPHPGAGKMGRGPVRRTSF
jgi:hypothetical protein